MVHTDCFFWVCFLPVVYAAIVPSVGGSQIEALRDIEFWVFTLPGAVAYLPGVFVGIGVRLMRGNALRKGSVWGVVAVLAGGVRIPAIVDGHFGLMARYHQLKSRVNPRAACVGAQVLGEGGLVAEVEAPAA